MTENNNNTNIINYATKSVCSKNIKFELENGIVKNVYFQGGCDGNLKGISSLVEGLPATSVIEKLKGLKCGQRPTSCPDQLATALENALINENLVKN